MTFGPGLFQDGMFSPHLHLDRFVFLVYEITRHIAIVMQQVVVDISQENCLLIQQHLFLWYHLEIQFPLLPEPFSWLKLQHIMYIPLYLFNSFS